MCTVLVTYNPSNQAANNLMYALSKTRGVKIDDDAIFTDEELRRIDEARNSGIRTDIENLQAYLKSQYES
jgi:hypothetical protein